MSRNNRFLTNNILPSLVTTLPTGADRYHGREVYYKPSGAAASPVWHCVWDTALNSDNGAWAVISGAPLVTRHTGSDLSTTSSTYTTITGSPTLTIPVTGLYTWSFSAITNNNGVNNWNTLCPEWATSADNRSIRHQTIQNIWQSVGREGGEASVITAGTKGFRYKTGGGTALWQDVSMSVFPVELRP
jgi:hypothetical protein